MIIIGSGAIGVEFAYFYNAMGSCGKTENQCREEGLDIKIGRMPYTSNGKALGMGETEGLVKTIFDAESGKLLGAHIIGAEAAEMIVSLGLARTLDATAEDLMQHMFPHPTLSRDDSRISTGFGCKGDSFIIHGFNS